MKNYEKAFKEDAVKLSGEIGYKSSMKTWNISKNIKQLTKKSNDT